MCVNASPPDYWHQKLQSSLIIHGKTNCLRAAVLEVWGSQCKSFSLMTSLTSSAGIDWSTNTYSAWHRLACCTYRCGNRHSGAPPGLPLDSPREACHFFTSKATKFEAVIVGDSWHKHPENSFLFSESQLSPVFLPVFPDVSALLCHALRM